MFSHIDILIKNLEQKENIIKYLNTIYKIEMGTDAVVPNPYISNIDKLRNEEKELENIFLTFQEKVDSLNLPSILDKKTKEKIFKLKKTNDTNFLIKHLNLSNYFDKGFDLILFKKVTDGIKILRSVEDINLRNNNMNDQFADSLCELFNLENLKRIDISYNNFTVSSAKKFINAIKSCDKLEYLDVSYNPFNLDYYSCSNICNSMRQHINLYHFGISDCSRDSAMKVLTYHPDLRSLNLEENKYNSKSYEYLSRFLVNKKYQLSILSLKFSTIDVISASFLEKALPLNKTIVYLNLYSTGLSDFGGSRIISAMRLNKTLVELDLGANKIGDEFCKNFGKILKVNNSLIRVNISKNDLLEDKNFSYILEGMVHNQTVTSLGDLLDTKIGVKIRESAEIILKMNREFIENQVELGFTKNLENIKINEFNTSQKLNIMRMSNDLDKLRHENLDCENEASNKYNFEDDYEKKVFLKYNVRFGNNEES